MHFCLLVFFDFCIQHFCRLLFHPYFSCLFPAGLLLVFVLEWLDECNLSIDKLGRVWIVPLLHRDEQFLPVLECRLDQLLQALDFLCLRQNTYLLFNLISDWPLRNCVVFHSLPFFNIGHERNRGLLVMIVFFNKSIGVFNIFIISLSAYGRSGHFPVWRDWRHLSLLNWLLECILASELLRHLLLKFWAHPELLLTVTLLQRLVSLLLDRS